jgi:hypothetical protein
MLRLFHGVARQRIVDSIAYQSYRRARGAFVGNPIDGMEESQQSFREAVDGLPDDPELDDLLRAIRRYL